MLSCNLLGLLIQSCDACRALLTITQKDASYQLPLDVQVLYKNGQTSVQTIFISKKVSIIQLPVTRPVRSVGLDPSFKVIHWDTGLESIAKETGPTQRVLLLIYQQKLDEAEKL